MAGRDPATELIENENVRYSVTFPVTGERNLKFQVNWFKREDVQKWLEYSQTKDAAFCFACRCFGSLVGCSEKEWTETGYNNWKRFLEKNKTFEKSNARTCS